jgi:hypothetical protein
MTNYVVASGKQIYVAAISGAKKKFNRSTDDYKVYEKMLHDFYELMLTDDTNQTACDRIRKHTKNNWRNANFSLTLVMYHCHRAMQPCATHARVCLHLSYGVFDIPLEYWKLFEEQSKQYA